LKNVFLKQPNIWIDHTVTKYTIRIASVISRYFRQIANITEYTEKTRYHYLFAK